MRDTTDAAYWRNRALDAEATAALVQRENARILHEASLLRIEHASITIEVQRLTELLAASARATIIATLDPELA